MDYDAVNGLLEELRTRVEYRHHHHHAWLACLAAERHLSACHTTLCRDEVAYMHRRKDLLAIIAQVDVMIALQQCVHVL